MASLKRSSKQKPLNGSTKSYVESVAESYLDYNDVYDDDNSFRMGNVDFKKQSTKSLNSKLKSREELKDQDSEYDIEAHPLTRKNLELAKTLREGVQAPTRTATFVNSISQRFGSTKSKSSRKMNGDKPDVKDRDTVSVTNEETVTDKQSKKQSSNVTKQDEIRSQSSVMSNSLRQNQLRVDKSTSRASVSINEGTQSYLDDDEVSNYSESISKRSTSTVVSKQNRSGIERKPLTKSISTQTTVTTATQTPITKSQLRKDKSKQDNLDSNISFYEDEISVTIIDDDDNATTVTSASYYPNDKSAKSINIKDAPEQLKMIVKSKPAKINDVEPEKVRAYLSSLPLKQLQSEVKSLLNFNAFYRQLCDEAIRELPDDLLQTLEYQYTAKRGPFKGNYFKSLLGLKYYDDDVVKTMKKVLVSFGVVIVLENEKYRKRCDRSDNTSSEVESIASFSSQVQYESKIISVSSKNSKSSGVNAADKLLHIDTRSDTVSALSSNNGQLSSNGSNRIPKKYSDNSQYNLPVPIMTSGTNSIRSTSSISSNNVKTLSNPYGYPRYNPVSGNKNIPVDNNPSENISVSSISPAINTPISIPDVNTENTASNVTTDSQTLNTDQVNTQNLKIQVINDLRKAFFHNILENEDSKEVKKYLQDLSLKDLQIELKKLLNSNAYYRSKLSLPIREISAQVREAIEHLPKKFISRERSRDNDQTSIKTSNNVKDNRDNKDNKDTDIIENSNYGGFVEDVSFEKEQRMQSLLVIFGQILCAENDKFAQKLTVIESNNESSYDSTTNVPVIESVVE